jgi:hypothetical protein
MYVDGFILFQVVGTILFSALLSQGVDRGFRLFAFGGYMVLFWIFILAT